MVKKLCQNDKKWVEATDAAKINNASAELLFGDGILSK